MAKTYRIGGVPFYAPALGGYKPPGSVVTVADNFKPKPEWGWQPVSPEPAAQPAPEAAASKGESQSKARRPNDEDVL